MIDKTYEERAKDRLVAKRQEDEETGCWLFTGTVTSNGYGHITFNGRSEYAHRLSAVLFLDFDLNSGLCVMHTCDRPPCFNPEHLTIGTQGDNMRDAAAKGRMTGKKLDVEQVAKIKYRLTTRNGTYRVLATEFGVSTTAIGQIARGETWKTVEPAADPGPAQEDSEEPS